MIATVVAVDPERARTWLDVLGTTRVRVVSRWTRVVRVPRFGLCTAWTMDLSALSEPQLERLMVHIMATFERSIEQVRRDVREFGGLPVPMQGCKLAED